MTHKKHFFSIYILNSLKAALLEGITILVNPHVASDGSEKLLKRRMWKC